MRFAIQVQVYEIYYCVYYTLIHAQEIEEAIKIGSYDKNAYRKAEAIVGRTHKIQQTFLQTSSKAIQVKQFLLLPKSRFLIMMRTFYIEEK